MQAGPAGGGVQPRRQHHQADVYRWRAGQLAQAHHHHHQGEPPLGAQIAKPLGQRSVEGRLGDRLRRWLADVADPPGRERRHREARRVDEGHQRHAGRGDQGGPEGRTECLATPGAEDVQRVAADQLAVVQQQRLDRAGRRDEQRAEQGQQQRRDEQHRQRITRQRDAGGRQQHHRATRQVGVDHQLARAVTVGDHAAAEQHDQPRQPGQRQEQARVGRAGMPDQRPGQRDVPGGIAQRGQAHRGGEPEVASAVGAAR